MKHIEYTIGQCINIAEISGLINVIPKKYYELCIINDFPSIRITTNFTVGICIDRIDEDIDNTGYDNSGGR